MCNDKTSKPCINLKVALNNYTRFRILIYFMNNEQSNTKNRQKNLTQKVVSYLLE